MLNVKLFAPTTDDGVRELVPEPEKPKMTPGRAAIVKLLSIYREMMYPLSQIEVQKLISWPARDRTWALSSSKRINSGRMRLRFDTC